MTSFHLEQQQLPITHTRHQVVLTVLAMALVASTIMTWMLVSAIRESNHIQRELLASQQVEPAAKTAVKARSDASTTSKAAAESRRSSSASRGRERNSTDRAVRDRTPGTQLASTQTILARQGRQ